MDIREYAHNAEQIASEADVENLETYEDRLQDYEDNRYSFIPMPADDRYYGVDDEALGDLVPEQVVGPDLHMVDFLDLLQDFPFLLVDRRYGAAFTVRNGVEINAHHRFASEEREDVLERLRAESAPDEEVYTLSELREHHPELVDHASGLHTAYEDQYMIITDADLNKRELREMLYRLLHELESNISDRIQEEYPDSEEILKYVRALPIGRWKSEQVRGMQLHVAEHLEIIDIMQVVQVSSNSFVDECGFSSKDDVQDTLGRINEVRDRVMHATRSLIYEKEDIGRVLQVIDDSQRILSNME